MNAQNSKFLILVLDFYESDVKFHKHISVLRGEAEGWGHGTANNSLEAVFAKHLLSVGHHLVVHYLQFPLI